MEAAATSSQVDRRLPTPLPSSPLHSMESSRSDAQLVSGVSSNLSPPSADISATSRRNSGASPSSAPTKGVGGAAGFFSSIPAIPAAIRRSDYTIELTSTSAFHGAPARSDLCR